MVCSRLVGEYISAVKNIIEEDEGAAVMRRERFRIRRFKCRPDPAVGQLLQGVSKRPRDIIDDRPISAIKLQISSKQLNSTNMDDTMEAAIPSSMPTISLERSVSVMESEDDTPTEQKRIRRSSSSQEETDVLDNAALSICSEICSINIADPARASLDHGAPEQQENINIVETCSCETDESCPSHGIVSLTGRRREMEDAVAAVPFFLSVQTDLAASSSRSTSKPSKGLSSLHFFAVYDGHGGDQAAMICKDRLHEVLAEEVKRELDTRDPISASGSDDLEVDWRRAMAACFSRMDAEVGGSCKSIETRSTFSIPETVGSTAVVVVVGPSQIVVGNCGDSRAVLSRAGKAISLSSDHKPDRKDEMARVEAAGGQVIFWHGFRVLGILGMSRAIGDRYLKPYIIPEPEVTCTARTEEDECLILASDGLWDVLSNDVACDIARRCLTGRLASKKQSTESSSTSADNNADNSLASTAAALLTKVALSKGSMDNISVVVVDLKVSESSENVAAKFNLLRGFSTFHLVSSLELCSMMSF